MALASRGVVVGGVSFSGGRPSAPLSPGGGLAASSFSRSAVHHLQLFKVISALKFILNVNFALSNIIIRLFIFTEHLKSPHTNTAGRAKLREQHQGRDTHNSRL